MNTSNKKKSEVWKDPNFIKLIIMLAMVVIYFFAELIVGIISGSLALIADAFHMLSDAISLVIGTVGVYVGHKKHNVHYTFGYARAEIVGGLVNAIFLLSVVMFIVLDAIERFFEPKRIDNPILVLGVAAGGFAINVIGMIMFCGHHHGHDHGHGHSHGKKEHKNESELHEHEHKHEEHEHKHEEHEHHHEHEHDHEHHHDNETHKNEHKHDHGHSHGHNENIFGVVLHIFGDLLGSVGVIIAASVILICRKYIGEHTDKYTVYIDPAISLVIAAILFFPTLPLVRRCIKVLMQSVPDSVSVETLRKELEKIDGVASLHELHVWSLIRDDRNIGSVHIIIHANAEHKPIVKKAKAVFHKFGVHSITVQVEEEHESITQCAFTCPVDCNEKLCCDDSQATIEKRPLIETV